MRETIATVLTQFPILTLSIVIGFGYLIGQIPVFGFRLGVAGVLFAGLAIGAISPDVALPGIVSILGLVIFIYTIGIQSGPTFRNPFGKQGYRDNVFGIAILIFGALVALAVATDLHANGPTIAGLFSGALTNAPALAAAQDVLRDIGRGRGLDATALKNLVDEPVIGFGIAYPFGVIGVMLTFRLLHSVFRVRFEKREGGKPILVQNFTVSNPGVSGNSIAEVLQLYKDLGFVISRIQHEGRISIPTADSRLEMGDVVVVVGDEDALARARHILGEPAAGHIEHDRQELDYKRVFVSSKRVVGNRIRDLELHQRLSATITRLRRGDIDLVPDPETRLEYGDLVRVLTNRENFARVSEFFGDSIRGTAETNFASVGLGMALGVIVGMIPVPLPGGNVVRLGLAGGPLVMALVLGKLERTGPINWVMPLSANLTLRQIGLLLFQAGVGTRAGFGFLQTIQTNGVWLLLGGAAITASVALAAVVIAHKVLKVPFENAMGLAAAIHTEPASLMYAGQMSGSDAPQMSYAGIFPVCTITKIVLAQLLVTR